MSSTSVATALIDTNVLVYRFDGRFPEKQKIATELLRRGIEYNSVRLPHQAIIEFVAATTRVRLPDQQSILPPDRCLAQSPDSQAAPSSGAPS